MKLINEMYAFVAIDEKSDSEGIVGALLGGKWMPLVAADMERVNALRPIIEGMVGSKEIKLIKFTSRTELESFGRKRAQA